MAANAKNPDPSGYITTKQLAELPLFPNVNCLTRWRALGNGPPYLRQGGRIFYRLKDVLAWQEGNIIHPSQNAPGQTAHTPKKPF